MATAPIQVGYTVESYQAIVRPVRVAANGCAEGGRKERTSVNVRARGERMRAQLINNKSHDETTTAALPVNWRTAGNVVPDEGARGHRSISPSLSAPRTPK